MTDVSPTRPCSIYLVAAEESGDALGASLARALRAREGSRLSLSGVGGRAMAAAGINSPFPIDELSIFGLTAIPRRLPLILRRIRETADAIIAARPNAVVIIDSPDFTHRVARRVRRRAALDSDPRLRLAVCLGLAAGTGAGHALLYRLRARHPSFRAGSLRQTWRPALCLCGPSADRTCCGPASASESRRTPTSRSAARSGFAGKP